MKDFKQQLEMREQAESEIPKPETRGATASSVESKRRIAAETGKFYNSLIDTYLEAKTLEARREQTDRLIEGLPDHMKKLYKEGLGRFQEELKENHTLLEQHRGDEIRYLLSAVMDPESVSTEKMGQIFRQIDKAKFIEPSPGVAIIQVEKDFFRLLKECGVVHAGRAMNFGSFSRGEPSFFMIQRLSLEESMAENYGLAKENRTVRHEFHHLVWNFLQRRGDYLREVAESSPEQAMAFRHFRDEVAAYIVEGRDVGSVEAELLTYAEDGKILKVATDARNFVTICIEVARQAGIAPQNFLYASMSSRNFAELKNAFTILTPLEKVDQQSIAWLYSAWLGNYKATSKVAELLERKRLTIPANLLEEHGLSRMLSADITSMGKIFSEAEKLKRFAGTVKIDAIDEQGLIKRAAQSRLPLPKETVYVILGLPREQLNDIPLDKSGEEFLESVVSFWSINRESARAAYKQIIDSSPEMREAFNKIRIRIIDRGKANYLTEFRSELKSEYKQRQKIESEVRESIRLLMEL